VSKDGIFLLNKTGPAAAKHQRHALSAASFSGGGGGGHNRSSLVLAQVGHD